MQNIVITGSTRGIGLAMAIAFLKKGCQVTLSGRGEELAPSVKEQLKEVPEMGTAFVHPDHQGQGIASTLLEELKREMRSRDIREFCLDSGYQRAQRIWKKKFGSPRYTFQNYWAEGVSHEIWIVKI